MLSIEPIRITAFDPGLTTGYAMIKFNPDESIDILERGVINCRLACGEDFVTLHERLQDIIWWDYSPCQHVVAIEAPVARFGVKSLNETPEIRGLIRLAAGGYNQREILCVNNSVKAFLGYGLLTKAKIKKAMEHFWHIKKIDSDHEADALAIALFALKKILLEEKRTMLSAIKLKIDVRAWIPATRWVRPVRKTKKRRVVKNEMLFVPSKTE